MKLAGLILLLCLANPSLRAQYFLTGEVKDPHGDKLQNVSISVQSTGAKFRTGLNGDFRIPSNRDDDTLSFSFSGYQNYTTLVSASAFMQLTLKRLPYTSFSNNQLVSWSDRTGSTGFTQKAATIMAGAPASSGPMAENEFNPQSTTITFRAGINKASYSYIQRFLGLGLSVPPEAVKIEEMVNYFNAYYEEPEKNDLFHCSSDIISCPWNATHRLLYLNVCARKADIASAPPSNLVFLIDASGSMDMPNKMPLVKAGFRSLIKNLRDKDVVSVVAYGGRTGVVLEGASGDRQEEIIRAVELLEPDGPTPSETGIRLAYQIAKRQFLPGGNNRILLITDGDVSEGSSSEADLDNLVVEQSQAGIHLSCFGIGMDSTQITGLPDLALKGHGSFAYANEEEEIGNLLVRELAPGPFAIAEHVCIATEFDSTLVKEYRLIGFDNKKSALSDSTLRLEGSKISSGHSVLALFEIVPKRDSIGIDTIAHVRIRYCLPGQEAGLGMAYGCINNPVPFERAENSLRKAACIALFGMKLQESSYVASIPWADIEKMARKTFTGNYFLDRQYLALVSKARRVYEHRPAAASRKMVY